MILNCLTIQAEHPQQALKMVLPVSIYLLVCFVWKVHITDHSQIDRQFWRCTPGSGTTSIIKSDLTRARFLVPQVSNNLGSIPHKMVPQVSIIYGLPGSFFCTPSHAHTFRQPRFTIPHARLLQYLKIHIGGAYYGNVRLRTSVSLPQKS